MGIGGTGSVTVVATLANAARLEGKHVIGLDQTGLAQKGGAVISDIKITHAPVQGSNKISTAAPTSTWASTSSTPPTRRTSTSATRSAPSRSCPPPAPPPADDANRKVMFPATRPHRRHRPRHPQGAQRLPRRPGLAEGLFGDAMATNNFMVGVAYQAGTIPLKAESIEAAIRLRRRRGAEPGRLPLGPHGGGRSAAFVEAEIAK
jgi:indolepyruvate ferredoxin oxidoreductase